MYEQVTVWHQNDPALFFIFLLALLVIHFIPSFVAFSRKHSSRMLILILNLLMGWTVLGWALLLYWAAKGKTDGLLV